VFIGPAAARQGQGTILAAGPQTLFDEVHPALARMAERVEYFGERPDLAAVFKLCGNAFIVGINAVVADVFAVAAGAGVPAAEAIKVIEYFNPSAIIAGRGKAMIARNYAASFELTMARKDVRLMIETAGDAPLAALPGIASRMDSLIDEGHGADDLAVMAKESVR
jgi:3-hydroxyisobutyrate dehydrogenase-like beta-hydroxyacid dehydrogenase